MKAGWEVKPLGEVCAKVSTGPFGSILHKKDYVDTGIPLVNPIDMVEGEIRHKSIKRVSQETADRLSAYKMKSGDIAVARRGDLGRCVLLGDEHEGWLCGTGSFYVTPSDAVNSDYLVEYIRSPAAIECFERASTGATMPNTSNKTLAGLRVPIPPLEEQKRIVAVLDAAFEGLTRAKENAEANLQNARELFESGFEAQLSNSTSETTSHHFGDPDILEIIDGDRGKSYPKKADFQPTGYCLFLSTKNVRQNGFKFDDCQFISEQKDNELRKGKLRRRDVVMTTRGTIGNIGLYSDGVPFDEVRINSGMLILRPNEERLSANYLFEALRSRVVSEQIEEQTSGAAQPQLPIRTLKELKLTIPNSLTVQADLVAGIQNHQRECALLEANYRTKLNDISDLRQSLLQKAFAGELT